MNRIDGCIQATIDRLAAAGKAISGSVVTEHVARDLNIERTPLLKEQSNRAVRRWYLRDVRMPHALKSLQFIGCLQPNAFTLAVAGWESERMPIAGPDGIAPPPELRVLFREAYAIACATLGLPDSEPDLRGVRDRTLEEVEEVIAAFRWAGLAQQAEAEALRAEWERRKA